MAKRSAKGAASEERFYRVNHPDRRDYGRKLIAGAQRASDGVLELERTGKFIPPISFPGWIATVIVRDDFRAVLKSSRLAPFQFQPIRQKTADRTGDRMGDVWELDLKSTATPICSQQEFRMWVQHLVIDPAAWCGDPLFFGQYASGNKTLCCTESGKKWLQAHAKKCVEFEPILSAPAPTRDYYVRDRGGRVVAEPSLEAMQQTLETMLDREAPLSWASVALGHRSGQVLTASCRYGRRTLTLEWSELGEEGETEAWELDRVSLKKALQLWRDLSQGAIDAVKKHDWK
jgi:hypothetical protein